MKRRNIILTFAIIALLLIGVGYAALTDTLTVNGTISANSAELVLEFDQTSEAATVTPTYGVAGVENAKAQVSYTNATTAKIDVTGLTNAGDTLVVVLKVLNKSASADIVVESLEAEVTGAVTKSAYYDVEASADLIDAKLNTGDDYATVTVTVKLLKSIDVPADQIDTLADSFTVTVTGQTK